MPLTDISTGQNIAFWILFAVIALTALATVTQRNIVHCAVSLMVCFLGIAGLFILLNAEFLGGVQVLIYVGAVTVLIIFAIMLTHGVTGRGVRHKNRQNVPGMVLAVLVLAAFAGLYRGIDIGSWQRAPVVFGPMARADQMPPSTTAAIGLKFVTEYVWPFEVASVVLLAALIGAIFIARDKTEASGQDTNTRPMEGESGL